MKTLLRRLLCRVRGHRIEYLEPGDAFPCVVVCDRCLMLGEATLLGWAPSDRVDE